MEITSGCQLGLYRIQAQLGAGAMGTVYRATDTKLERDVAIKVLPEQLAEAPEALARFEREARMLAALNHPNIATIHGFEQSGGVHYLVKEPDWQVLPASTPDSIRNLLRKCLEKDASQRLRDIGEARKEIEKALAPATRPAQISRKVAALRKQTRFLRSLPIS